jgi:ABC-2 type transport system permease protein
MFQLHTKKFLRSKVAVAALLLTFGIGLVSIYTGKAFLQKQNNAIAATAQYQKEHIERLVKYENKEFGLLMYYLKFAYVNKPLPITALAIGQRDVNSSIQAVTIRGLEAQKYDTDLHNPFNLMMGNLDLSFVILYIFPLLIIVLSFNLLSEEKENGTWCLVDVQTQSSLQFLLQKLLVIALFSLGVLLSLFVASTIILAIPIDQALLQFVGISVLYLLFWLSICFFIVSLNKTSGANAIALLSIWLFLTILLPAAVNNYISTRYPVPEALSTMLKQRDGYHRKWDLPKEATMQQFYAAYPQYKDLKWQAQGFDWLWYYAMQHAGDLDATDDRKALVHKLQARNAISNTIAWFIPSVNLQLQHNELSQSSLSNYVNFLESTTHFHENVRLYFYPKIFAAAPVLQENWSNHLLSYHPSKTYRLPMVNAMSFLLMIGLLFLGSLLRLKSINK